MSKNILLKYILIMIPSMLLNVALCMQLHPKLQDSAWEIPILFLLSVVNLVTFHKVVVPLTIKEKLMDILTGKNDRSEMEDLLVKIINDAKKRQAAFNGFSKLWRTASPYVSKKFNCIVTYI